MKKVWPILVMQLTKCRFCLVARGVQLDNGVTPLCACDNSHNHYQVEQGSVFNPIYANIKLVMQHKCLWCKSSHQNMENMESMKKELNNTHKPRYTHYKKPVFFVMSPKIVDVLLDINILEKEM
jgi:hypothetical protein